MEKFTRLAAVAAPLPVVNVDTDKIIPAVYLKALTRSGLGKALFQTLRYDEQGRERPDFVLNREPYRQAKILVSGANFGCGSSREHAPWALDDFGIRVVIAPSFADIFFNNCFKIGMLPIVLPQATVDLLMADAESGKPLTIDLEKQEIRRPDGSAVAFSVDSFRRHSLLNGLDDIGLTLRHEADITAFEAKQKAALPWLWT